MAREKRKIAPTHPGEMLRKDFLPDYGLTVTSLASVLNVSRQTINEVLRERRAISPIMALRLSRLLILQQSSVFVHFFIKKVN